MKQHLAFVLAIFICLPIFAMAKKPTADKRPAWVDDPKSEYPEAMYLSAIGTGSSRADAENNAAGNLAKIFRSDVSATDTYQESYTELVTNTAAKAATVTTNDKKVTVKANESLMNIETGKSWTYKLGRVYAVAYINRLRTADIYEEKIDENAALIRHYTTVANYHSSPLPLYANYHAAYIISQENQKLLDQLQIISVDTRQSIDLGYSPEAIKSSMQQWAAQISFDVQVEGDIDGKVAALIGQILTANGFSVASGGMPLEARLTFEDVDLNLPQKFVRYTLNLNIYNERGGDVVVTIADSGREGHLNKEEARARALRTLNDKIKKELPARLFQYIDNYVSVQQ